MMIATNTNPNFYQTDVVDPETSRTRRLVYSTQNEPLVVSQIGHLSDEVLSFPTNDVTINATVLTLIGRIVVPDGNLKIVCRTLRVSKGAPATIDVSPKLEAEYADGQPGRAVGSVPSSKPDRAASGLDHARANNKKYGQPGKRGGSIEIHCDRIELEDTLTLDARGGDGYPGHDGENGGPGGDGQDGLTVLEDHGGGGHPGSIPHLVPVVKQHSQQGHPGQKGGDALGGGAAGQGGTVVFAYVSAAKPEAKDQVKILITAGKPGRPGNPGKGGPQGAGGKMYQGGQVVSQESPRDHEPRRIAPSGATAEHGKVALDGRRRLVHKANLDEIGRACDAHFLSMLFQSLRFRYLNCSPTKFDGKEIDFPHGSRDEWKAIGRDLGWMHDALRPFRDAKGELEAARKANLFALVSTLQVRFNHYQTLFGKRATWIPRESFDSLHERFKDEASTAGRLEAAFYKLAKDYERKNVARIDKAQHELTLQATQQAYLEQYRETIGKLPALVTAIDVADLRVREARTQLKESREKLQAGLQTFHCDIETILKAAEMMAFCHGSPGMAGGMGAVELAGILNQGFTKIPTSDRGSVSTEHFIHELVQIGEKLRDDMTAHVRNGVLDDKQAPTFLAQLDQLDKLIDEIRNQAPNEATDAKRAVQEYRNAIVRRSESLVAYNVAVLSAVQLYQRYEEDAAELTAVKNSDAVNPYDLQIFANVARRHQEQTERLMEIVESLERKRCFLKVAGTAPLDTTRLDWLGLWYGKEPGDHKVDEFLETVNDVKSRITADYVGAQSVRTRFPDEQDHSIRLSGVHVRLPEAMVAELRERGEVTFKLVGEKQAQRPDEVEVANTANKFDFRVQNIRPHLVGAKTESGVVEIDVTCEGDSLIDDSSGSLRSFHHDIVNTSFTHFTSFEEPSAHTIYEPVREGEPGLVSDDVLDLVGLFGTWTLSVAKSTPEDWNHNLVLSGVKQVLIYFTGYHLTRHH